MDVPPAKGPEDGSQQAQQEDIEAVKAEITQAVLKAEKTDPDYHKRSLTKLGAEAAVLQKSGQYVEAIAAYHKVFLKAKRYNLIHKDLYVLYGNRASAFLKLGLFQESLLDAEKSRAMAEESLKKTASAASAYIRCFPLKAKALIGLKRYKEALHVLDQGLKMDPFDPDMKQSHEEAHRLNLRDILDGKGCEILALPSSETVKHRITYHSNSTALYKIRDENMMPTKLLSTFHADNDYHIKDTYNYVTVRTDVTKPVEHLQYLEDEYRQSRMAEAVKLAVQAITDKDVDCRVLHMGAGAGMHSLNALRAGAYHVTAAERWLYLASVCKEVLLANGCTDAQAKVVYKRPADLALLEDVPIVCNLLIAELLDDGLLSSGLIPGISHALNTNLLTHDAVVIPASATVYMQAVEIRTPKVCGLDLASSNAFRWLPSHSSGTPYDQSLYRPLSEPREVWHFDMLNPPTANDFKTVDVEFASKGVFNTVMFWYDLHLAHGVHLCTGPHDVRNGLSSLQPAIQYLHGEISVDSGMILPVTASHNTIRLSFEVKEADYMRLHKPAAAFPRRQFSMLADTLRNEAYDRAIRRAVASVKETAGEVHALDMGAGSGLLSLMAARAGADTVVAAELMPDLCDLARWTAASNGLADKISVVNRDVARLQRGRDVRTRGVNLVVADLFDAGLFGYSFEWMLQMAQKNVIQPGAKVVPAAATMYCVGIEALTKDIGTMHFSPMNKYRWDKTYHSVDMRRIPHRVLTKPKKVSEIVFNSGAAQGRDSLLKLEVVEEGQLNAILFWFDLHLDEEETISTAPPGYTAGGLCLKDGIVSDMGGLLKSLRKAGDDTDSGCPEVPAGTGHHKSSSTDERPPHYWGQALQYLSTSVQVKPGGKRLPLLAKRDGSRMSFSLRNGVGSPVERAPWKVEWGGGSSIENPHVQRVQYCDLLVKDFLQRVKGKRFPPIEKDMKMVLAQCGSLYLDPGAASEVYHHMVLLEKIHQDVAEFSPGVVVEAMTEPPLSLN